MNNVAPAQTSALRVDIKHSHPDSKGCRDYKQNRRNVQLALWENGYMTLPKWEFLPALKALPNKGNPLMSTLRTSVMTKNGYIVPVFDFDKSDKSLNDSLIPKIQCNTCFTCLQKPLKCRKAKDYNFCGDCYLGIVKNSNKCPSCKFPYTGDAYQDLYLSNDARDCINELPVTCPVLSCKQKIILGNADDHLTSEHKIEIESKHIVKSEKFEPHDKIIKILRSHPLFVPESSNTKVSELNNPTSLTDLLSTPQPGISANLHPASILPDDSESILIEPIIIERPERPGEYFKVPSRDTPKSSPYVTKECAKFSEKIYPGEIEGVAALADKLTDKDIACFAQAFLETISTKTGHRLHFLFTDKRSTAKNDIAKFAKKDPESLSETDISNFTKCAIRREKISAITRLYFSAADNNTGR